jgi:hypothetical protein
MNDTELLDHVRRLRGEGRSPKEIARSLGKPPSVITRLVRIVAAEREAGEPELVGCWVNNGWSQGLTFDESRGWTDETPPEPADDGMVSVLVARRHGWDKVVVAGYLVDAYCLGIKQVFTPRLEDDVSIRRFLPIFYQAYSQGWREAPLDLAQHLVYGAVDYARGLGFEPHAAYADAAVHLGAWEGPSAITFGKDGKPFYVAGPYDNPAKVTRTLTSTVGPPPAYDYIIVA